MNPKTPLKQFTAGLNAAKWRQIADSDIFEDALSASLLELQLRWLPTDAINASQNSYRMAGAQALVDILLNLGLLKNNPIRRDDSALTRVEPGWGPPPLTPPPGTEQKPSYALGSTSSAF